MLPIRTERLTIRHLRATDMPVVAAYRNDPEVARFQDWALPYDQQAAIDLNRRPHHGYGATSGHCANEVNARC